MAKAQAVENAWSSNIFYYLDNHVSKIERSNLYAIVLFFVEVIYDPQQDAITEVKSFKTEHLLDKYASI